MTVPVLPTATLRVLAQRHQRTLDPFEEVWLTRRVLTSSSHEGVETISKYDERAAGIRQASGRWQVVNRGRGQVYVARMKDLNNAIIVSLRESATSGVQLPRHVTNGIAQRNIATVTPAAEFDAHDGEWAILVDRWLAVLRVRGQEPRSIRVAGRIDDTNPSHLFRVPTQPDHRENVRVYLGIGRNVPDPDRARPRRLALAQRYCDQFTYASSPWPEQDAPVNEIFGVQLTRIRSALRQKIWVAGGEVPVQPDAELARYLWHYRHITADDVARAWRFVLEWQARRGGQR